MRGCPAKAASGQLADMRVPGRSSALPPTLDPRWGCGGTLPRRRVARGSCWSRVEPLLRSAHGLPAVPRTRARVGDDALWRLARTPAVWTNIRRRFAPCIRVDAPLPDRVSRHRCNRLDLGPVSCSGAVRGAEPPANLLRRGEPGSGCAASWGQSKILAWHAVCAGSIVGRLSERAPAVPELGKPTVKIYDYSE